MKTLIRIILTLMIILCLGFVGCDVTGDPCDVCNEDPCVCSCEHEFSDNPEDLDITEATCEEFGVTKKLCEKCDEWISFPINPLGHKWIDIPVTCETDGLKECENCGEKKDIIPATDHDWVYVEAVEADIENGIESSDEYWECSICGEKRNTDPNIEETEENE